MSSQTRAARRSGSIQESPHGAEQPSGEAIESHDLFKGRREIVIVHNDQRYVLRITRQGKLILNK